MLLYYIAGVLAVLAGILFVGYKAYDSACYHMDYAGIKIKVTSLVILTISLCIVEFGLIRHLFTEE